MELRINLVILSILGVAFAALASGEPVAALDPAAARTKQLARLEDQYARNRDDHEVVQQLAETYLAIDAPELAVAALRGAKRDLLEDPVLAHRLAQAYERSGRVMDALAVANAALTSCGRAVGSSSVSPLAEPPSAGCTEGTYAALDIHRAALERMAAWGVSDPRTDVRAAHAYELVVRRARVASF